MKEKKELESSLLEEGATIHAEIEERSSSVNIYEDVAPYPVSNLKMASILFGLSISMFISSLDDTILATALAAIASDFKSLNQITWVSASYLLTVSATIALYGKFSDIFGRRVAYMFALFFFLTGSIVCGLSESIELLIIFRAVSGIGGGGLMTLAMIVISDIVKPSQRGQYLSLVGAVYSLSCILGPMIGGTLVDNVSWRWTFYINIPVCILAILILGILLDIPTPEGSIRSKLNRIDILGSLTILIAVSTLILGLNWGGNDYAWDSPTVISTLVVSFLFFILFGLVEWKWSIEPIIPGKVLNQNVISCGLTNFFIGFTFITTLYYIPLYYQIVHGYTATKAGLELIPFLISVVTMAGLSGVFIAKSGCYKALSIVGTILMITGTILFGTLLTMDITRSEQIGYLVILGIGYGLCIQTQLIVVQGSVAHIDVAVATSFNNFALLLGNCIGIAILGAIFSHFLKSSLIDKLPGIDVDLIISSKEAILGLPLLEILKVQEAHVEGIRIMYLALIPFNVLALISTLFLKKVSLTGQN